MSPLSLRARLTLLLVAGIGLPLATAGLVLAFLVPSWLRARFDEGLDTRAQALASLTRETEGEVELEFDDQLMPQFDDEDEPLFFELWLADGTFIENSRSFQPARGVILPALHRDIIVSDALRRTDVTLPDGQPGRQVQIDFVPELHDPNEDQDEDDPEEEPFEEDEDHVLASVALAEGSRPVATILVAEGTESLDERIAAVRLGAAVGTPLVLLALALIVRLALHLGLRPVAAVVQQVASIDANSLDARLVTDSAPAEFRPLLEQVNGLIDRLAGAFRRERQLTADMAHELKTPIAELRNLGEVGERWPDDRAAVIRFFEDARSVACHMERVVAHLLALARHDAGQQAVATEDVDVVALVGDTWRPLARNAEQRGMTFVLQASGPAVACSDQEKLALILSNLLSNAVSHGEAGTPIRCTVLTADPTSRSP